MSPEAIRFGAAGIDLSERVFRTATVVASPADATETVIASLSITPDLAVGRGVLLLGYAAWTVGTAGVTGNVRLRRDSVTGTIVRASGAQTCAATELRGDTIVGLDTGPTFPNEVYVLTLTVGSASAASTVSAVELVGLVV